MALNFNGKSHKKVRKYWLKIGGWLWRSNYSTFSWIKNIFINISTKLMLWFNSHLHLFCWENFHFRLKLPCVFRFSLVVFILVYTVQSPRKLYKIQMPEFYLQRYWFNWTGFCPGCQGFKKLPSDTKGQLRERTTN